MRIILQLTNHIEQELGNRNQFLDILVQHEVLSLRQNAQGYRWPHIRLNSLLQVADELLENCPERTGITDRAIFTIET